MSIYSCHIYYCSICQTSNCCVCQQLKKQIEDLSYMKILQFRKVYELERQYNYLGTMITELSTLQPIVEELTLEKQFHQLYSRDLATFDKLLFDHQQNPWHK